MSQGQRPALAGAADSRGPTEEQIREELNRVLASHEFRTSKRSQDFLRYTVENTLKGHADMLKERTIGIEVFGRSTSYDPSDDATVRVKAGEVRKRLGLYYASEGSHNPLRIELPSGTYIPEFRVVTVEAPAVAVAAEGHAPGAVPVVKPRFSWRVGLAGAAALVAGLGLLSWLLLRPQPTKLDEFWAPVFKGPSPVLVCAAFVPVWGRERDGDPTYPSARRIL